MCWVFRGLASPTDTLWGGSRASLAKHMASPQLAAVGSEAAACKSERVAQGHEQQHGGWHWGGMGRTQTDRHQAKGKERVRHITNLRAGLSGAGAGSSLERSAAGKRTRADVTLPGGWRPLPPSSSLLSGTALSHASCPGGPACLTGQTPVPGWEAWDMRGAQGDPTSDGGSEAAADPDGAGGRQHFYVPRLVLRESQG